MDLAVFFSSSVPIKIQRLYIALHGTHTWLHERITQWIEIADFFFFFKFTCFYLYVSVIPIVQNLLFRSNMKPFLQQYPSGEYVWVQLVLQLALESFCKLLEN